MKLMLIPCIISRPPSALCCMIILLNLIDCQDVIKLITNSTASDNKLANSHTPIKPSLAVPSIRSKSKLTSHQQAKEGLRHKAALKTSSSKHVVVLVKRSIANGDSSSNNNNLTAPIVEPIEIIERVTNDTHDSLRSSIKAQKGATKADEIRGEGLRVKLPKIRLPKDGPSSTHDARDSFAGSDLVGSIKRFLGQLTTKISLSAKSLIKIGNEHHGAETGNYKPGWLQDASRMDAGEDQLANYDSLRQRPKRLSKPEMVEKILSDINIDSILGGRRRFAGLATNGAPTSANTAAIAITSSTSSSGHNGNKARFSLDMMTRTKDSNPIESSNDKRRIGGDANEPPSQTGTQGAANGIKTDQQAGKQTRQQIVKSTSDIFKENLSVMLEDTLEEWNSTHIDLDHLIKLHQQQTATSFQPIDQLKKVMSFMHFG